VRYSKAVTRENAILTVIRRLGIAMLGVGIVLAGVAMLFLPGPGLLTILAGLAVLGSEFERPRRWVNSLRARLAARR
jgi:hypothetical protein